MGAAAQPPRVSSASGAATRGWMRLEGEVLLKLGIILPVLLRPNPMNRCAPHYGPSLPFCCMLLRRIHKDLREMVAVVRSSWHLCAPSRQRRNLHPAVPRSHQFGATRRDIRNDRISGVVQMRGETAGVLDQFPLPIISASAVCCESKNFSTQTPLYRHV